MMLPRSFISLTVTTIVGLCLMLSDILCRGVAAAQPTLGKEVKLVVGAVGKNITLQTGISKVPHDSDILWSFGTEQYVLVYYTNGQLLNQTMDRFRGRLHLDHETGSLTIMDLRLNDTGIYYGQVLNGANSHHWFNFTVLAPVVSVSMELERDTLTCSSRGIYPEPTLTWSTSTSTNHTFNYSTMVTKTTEQLYDVSSSLTFTAEDSQLDYICSVATEGGGKTITVSRLSPVHGYDSDDVDIPCKAPSSALKDFSVTWSFNHTTILSYLSTNTLPLVTDEWKGRVKGALQLSASSVKLEGVYRCELTHADNIYVTYTTLKINQKPGGSVGAIVGGTMAAVFIGIIAVAIYWFRKRRGKNNTPQGTTAERENLETSPV